MLVYEFKETKADIVMVPLDSQKGMDPEEAAEAVNILRPKLAIPMAYSIDTAYLADEFEELCEVPMRRFDNV